MVLWVSQVFWILLIFLVLLWFYWFSENIGFLAFTGVGRDSIHFFSWLQRRKLGNLEKKQEGNSLSDCPRRAIIGQVV